MPLWSSRFNFSCWSFDRGDPIDNRYRTCLDVLLFICYFNGWWFRCLVGADDVFGDGGAGLFCYRRRGFSLRGGDRFGDRDRLVGGVGCLLGRLDLGRGKLGELLGLFGRVAGVDPSLRVCADGGGVGRLVGEDTAGAAKGFEDLASGIFESGIGR